MSAVVFYYRRSEFTARSKCTIRSVFSTGGSFGWGSFVEKGGPQKGWYFVFPPRFHLYLATLVAQCSATPATVAATPPCSATPSQTQISVRHLPGQGGARCDTKILRGCSATLVLHLQNAIKSRKSAATRVARHV